MNVTAEIYGEKVCGDMWHITYEYDDYKRLLSFVASKAKVDCKWKAQNFSVSDVREFEDTYDVVFCNPQYGDTWWSIYFVNVEFSNLQEAESFHSFLLDYLLDGNDRNYKKLIGENADLCFLRWSAKDKLWNLIEE